MHVNSYNNEFKTLKQNNGKLGRSSFSIAKPEFPN